MKELPVSLFPLILSYINDAQTINSIRRTSSVLRSMSLQSLSHCVSIIEEYIIRHPLLTDIQKAHLRSPVTQKCVLLQIDSIENLARQCEPARIEELTRYIQSIDLLARMVGIPYMLDLQLLQRDMDILNNWRIERSSLSLATTNDELFSKILFGEDLNSLRQFAVIMGLQASQINIGFTYVHFEAVCKGFHFPEIQNLSENNVKAIILGEKLEDINDARTTQEHLSFCKLGIPLKETLGLDEDTMRLVVVVIGTKIQGMKNENILKFNWRQYYQNILARIKNCDDFKSQDEVLQLKIIAALPQHLHNCDEFSIYHTYMYVMGYSLLEICSLTELEARAVHLGLTPREAIYYRCGVKLLEKLEIHALFHGHAHEKLLDSEEFKRWYALTEEQLEISTYYNNEKLAGFDVNASHSLAVMLLKDLSNDKIEAMLEKPGNLAAGLELGLTPEQINHPWISYVHIAWILENSLTVSESGEILLEETRSKARQNYEHVVNLNMAQLYGLLYANMSGDFVKNILVPPEYYAACKIHQENIINLLPYQLIGMAFGLGFMQVQQPWFRMEHAIAWKQFKGLLEFEDLNPNNIQALVVKHNIPLELQSYKNLTWAHILAYLRHVPSLHLLKVNMEQALGLAIGLNLSQVKNDWFNAVHVVVLMQDPNLQYDEIKELNKIQVWGVDEGFSREDVLSDWYTAYHCCALGLGYNIDSIRGATVAQVKSIVASTYSSPVDFDEYVRKSMIESVEEIADLHFKVASLTLG